METENSAEDYGVIKCINCGAPKSSANWWLQAIELGGLFICDNCLSVEDEDEE